MPCPICRSAAEHEFRPFCSRRCADIDLGRWVSGRYAIAGAIAPDEEELASAPEPEQPPRRARSRPSGET